MSERNGVRCSHCRIVAVLGVAMALVGTVPSGVAAGTAACPPLGITRPSMSGSPMMLSSLVGAHMRTGGHDCFERVVLEFQGDGELPGYRVEDVDDPVQLSPSDDAVEIAGGATLLLSVGMIDPEGGGYAGPNQIFPTNVESIAELRLVENFEGMHAWAIGLDTERPFVVSTLTDPFRIVIDVQRAPAGPRPAPAPGATVLVRGRGDVDGDAAAFAFAFPGTVSYGTADLTPGRYVALCFLPEGATPEVLMQLEEAGVGGPEDTIPEDFPIELGPPHFTKGMAHEFTVA